MRRPPRGPTLLAADALVAMAGAALSLAGLVLIWRARLQLGLPVYVSQLGADGMATARGFEVALLLVAAGGAAVAWPARRVRSTAPLLGRWSPALTLAVASGAFALASQVRCTLWCPVPLGSTFTWQDLGHTTLATVGFGAACVAMVQVAFSDVRRAVALVSLGAAVGVGVVAGIGGILALLRVPGGVGGTLEHVAATLAIGWLVVLGAALSRAGARPLAPAGPGLAPGAELASPRPGRA